MWWGRQESNPDNVVPSHGCSRYTTAPQWDRSESNADLLVWSQADYRCPTVPCRG